MSESTQTREKTKTSKVAGEQLSRRRFLTRLAQGMLFAATVLVVDQVIRFLSFQPAANEDTTFPVGSPYDFLPDALGYVAVARAYVGRDVEGLYALDAVCPHLGCLVEPRRGGGFKCPCHGSRFNADGEAKAGPASKSLRHLYLWLAEDGQLMVDRAQAVEPTTRLIL